jgi:Icc-related predicted phosphoesterase
MRVFATSDLHVDYDANAKWIDSLSAADYQEDVLILAGDVTHARRLLEWCLTTLAKRFRKLLFVPGNHDLWVTREVGENSLQKFQRVCGMATDCGASMGVFQERGLSIVPLLSWYDYSFGEPSEELRSIWMDYRACRWPNWFTEQDITAYFAGLNQEGLASPAGKVITYSHFLPRLDLVPTFIPKARRVLIPVLGSTVLERQLRSFRPSIHVYGHSHINRCVKLDGIAYVNNAFGYPSENLITAKNLVCIHQT